MRYNLGNKITQKLDGNEEEAEERKNVDTFFRINDGLSESQGGEKHKQKAMNENESKRNGVEKEIFGKKEKKQKVQVKVKGWG